MDEDFFETNNAAVVVTSSQQCVDSPVNTTVVSETTNNVTGSSSTSSVLPEDTPFSSTSPQQSYATAVTNVSSPTTDELHNVSSADLSMMTTVTSMSSHSFEEVSMPSEAENASSAASSLPPPVQSVEDFGQHGTAVGSQSSSSPQSSENSDDFETQMHGSSNSTAQMSPAFSTPNHVNGLSDMPAITEPEEGPNVLTEFMLKWEAELEVKLQTQAEVGIAANQKARSDMEKFLAEREMQRDTRMAANRTAEQATMEKLVADLENDNPWERVVTLVDISSQTKPPSSSSSSSKKSLKKKKEVAHTSATPTEDGVVEKADISRMRQIFIQLKSEPLVVSRKHNLSSS